MAVARNVMKLGGCTQGVYGNVILSWDGHLQLKVSLTRLLLALEVGVSSNQKEIEGTTN